jgi:hypothetical protein
MIEQLFGSKTRVKLLRLFFSNPNRSFYVREITRKVDEQINSVRRELANMLSLGIITSDSSNNKLYYEVNQEYEYFKPLQTMFSELRVEEKPTASSKPKAKESTKSTKTSSKDTPEPIEIPEKTVEKSIVELPEAKHWAKAGNITGIAYSGVYTRDETASVDILIIGDAVVSTIESVISELEKEKNKELKYAIIEASEWKYRRQVRDKFWLQFMAAKKQIVLDRADVFNNK